MFESTDPGALPGEIEESQRDESMLIARRMAAIAALLYHRIGQADGVPSRGPGYALITGFTRTSAEVAAALSLSARAASQTVGQAATLSTSNNAGSTTDAASGSLYSSGATRCEPSVSSSRAANPAQVPGAPG